MTNILTPVEFATLDAFLLEEEVLFTDESEHLAEPAVEYLGQLAIPYENYRSYDTKNSDPDVALAEQDAQDAHYSELADYFLIGAENEGTTRMSAQVLGKVLREVTALDMSPKTIEGILLQLPDKGTNMDKRTLARHMIFLRSVDAMKQRVHGEDYETTLKDVKLSRRSIKQRKSAQISQRLALAAHGRHVDRQPLPDHEHEQHHDH